MSHYIDYSPKNTINNNLIGYDYDVDNEAVKNSIRNIFTIQKGECPGKPWFGNPLNIALFDLFDFFTNHQLEVSIINTLKLYEPRIVVENVDVHLAPEYNRIIVLIYFHYNIDNSVIYDSLEMPYTHNSISYLGGRIERPPIKPVPQHCNLRG